MAVQLKDRFLCAFQMITEEMKICDAQLVKICLKFTGSFLKQIELKILLQDWRF